MASPIRSPRGLYKIAQITRPQGALRVPVLAKFKRTVGDWLNLDEVEYNDPIFSGVFSGSGLNQGAKYRKRLGGYRSASYILVAKTQFVVQEYVRNAQGDYVKQDKKVKTISLGFPRGHSVNEVVAFVGSTNRLNEIDAVITPSGSRVPV